MRGLKPQWSLGIAGPRTKGQKKGKPPGFPSLYEKILFFMKKLLFYFPALEPRRSMAQRKPIHEVERSCS